MLNILKDLVEVRMALELMEGEAIAYSDGPNSLEAALLEFSKYLKHKEKYPDIDDPVSVAIIYGRFGVHRYFLKPDGTIKFSTFHMGWKDVRWDAASLGFIIDNY